MGRVTEIAYADSTVNPVCGCASPCELYDEDPNKNICYAATLVRRYAGLKGWPQSFTEPAFFPGRLEEALHWPDLTGTDRPDKPWLNGLPRVIFVGDTAENFAPKMPGEIDPMRWLAPMLSEISASPHILLLLTKWPHRMREFFEKAGEIPRNLWPGTTITGPETGWRLGELVKIGGNARLWLSLEPLLGRVSLGTHSPCGYYCGESVGHVDHQFVTPGLQGPIKFVAAGGASGHNAPPTHPSWVRLVKGECQLAGVPFFFKQWGTWLPDSQVIQDNPHHWPRFATAHFGTLDTDGKWSPGVYPADFPVERQECMFKLGRKNAGDLLDGKERHEFPSMPGECDGMH